MITKLMIDKIEFLYWNIRVRINRNVACLFLKDNIRVNKKRLYTYQPLRLYKSGGNYILGNDISIGYSIGGRFKNGYCELQARNKHSQIIIGNNVSINNNFLAISCKSIEIGNNCRIGANCTIIDSDFHGVDSEERSSPGKSLAVKIMNNVWIGNDCMILKGVEIGENSVVAAGSVVTKIIPSNEVWGGNPAHFIKNIH